ncbi:MAG: transaldolase [Anaerolineae bacterium]|nr:transaldolase [Anaerolineae bacterium]
MGIYLDSAKPEDARRAQSLVFVEAITTNPTLIAATGRPGLDVLGELVEIFDGHVFYQVTAPTGEGRVDEAWEAHEIRPDKVVIKIPATTENFAMAAKLVDAGIECAMTAVYSPAQAYLAAQTEVTFVIPHVNDLKHHLGDSMAVVRAMARLVEGTSTEVLATGLESVDEVVAALLAGAHHVAVPFDLILAMGDYTLAK